MTTTPSIFDPATIGTITLRNRFIRAATHEGMANPDGTPTDSLEKLYLRLAKGGAGAIITGHTAVTLQGKCSYPGMMTMHDDALVAPSRKLVEAVHREGASVILQLSHAGRQTRSSVTGMTTVAPSRLRDRVFNEELPHELSEGEIGAIIDAFAKAVVRAMLAGYDGVELHLAHGYLLSQFLSGYTNRRRDRWGGTLENRFRIVSEIMKRIRQRTGDYPVLAKINGYDAMPGGIRLGEATAIAGMLESTGCTAVEISSGIVSEGFSIMRGPRIPVEPLLAAQFRLASTPRILKPALARLLPLIAPATPKALKRYNIDSARAIKKAVSIPVIAVGGIHTREDAVVAIADGDADFVSMSRPFIIEPDIVRKMLDGSQHSSKCIQCNYCAVMIETGPLRCWYGRMPQTP